MKHYESFNFDGISSLDKGVSRVHLNSGLFEEAVVSSRSIERDTSVSGRISYLTKTNQENIKIELTLYFENGYSEEALNDIKSWLYTDYYRPFYYEENPSKICYVVSEGEINLRHDGVNAIMDIVFTANSKYWFGREVVVDAAEAKRFDLISKGSYAAFPVITITGRSEVSSTLPVKVKNIRSNEEILITQIVPGEAITIDCFLENIRTSLPNIYRFDQFNDIYPRILPGLNVFEVSGDVSVSIQYRDVYI